MLGELLRRRIAGGVLAIGLVAASIAYSGSIVRSIVVDDDVAINAASAALDDDTVRALLATRTSDALEQQLFASAMPALGYDPAADLDEVTAAVLDHPGFEAAFVDAVRELHRVVLVERGAVPEIDVTPLVGVARDAAIGINPAYADLLPQGATVHVPVPADDLPDLTDVSSALADRTKLAAIVAVVAAAVAFVLHPHRPRVVRRVGVWALGVAAVQTAVAFGVSYAARRLPGDVAPIATAVADTMRPRLVVPAAMMAAAGVALVVGAWRWKRSLDATHERIGAHAFLAQDPTEPVTPMTDGAIEVATLRSPMGAPPVPLTGSGNGALLNPGITPGNEPVPTMPRGA